MLDLEKVAERSAIDRSYDLRAALETSRLRLCSQGVISKTVKPEKKIIEQHHYHSTDQLNEEKIAELLKKIVLENQVKVDSGDATQQILQAMNALKDKIDSISSNNNENHRPSEVPAIDPEKLAELQSRAIDKMSATIETGNKKPGKKVTLKNTKLGDLANELD